MKRAFAILLVLALLIPMGAVTSVNGSQVDVKPFYVVNWQAERTDYEYVYTMPFFYCNISEITENTTSLHIYNFYGDSNATIAQLANDLKNTFDARPEGTRYINFPMMIEALAEDKVYLEKGTALVRDWIDEFFKEYKEIGGKLDGLNVDVEYIGGHAWYVRTAALTDTGLYDRIVQNPLYTTEIRPKLAERGFNFGTSADESEIYGISVPHSAEYNIWDAVMTNRICEYINEASEPLFDYFPDALINNYCYPSSKAWNGNIAENGRMSVGGNTDYAGNTANQNFYLRRPHDDFYESSPGNPKYIKPLSYNNAVYDKSVFHSFMWEMMVFKNMYESSDNKRVSAWVAGYNFRDSGEKETGSVAETPYYAETLYHIGLMDPQPFIGYIRYQDTGDSNYNDAIRIASEVMGELTRVAGTADREPISVPNYWNSSFVLSGMYAGGRNIWRLTPDTEKVSLADFKVKDQAPTFEVDGQTIIFPQGRILEDSTIYRVGTSGYWIETPANVKPVIINDTDRYSEYPSYIEDFETYSTGTTFNASTAQHKTAWEVDGTLTVQTNGGDKALAMIGNASLTQVKLPEKITAGDSYAKQQVWEVTVTVPSGGEMTLLTGGGSDGGFKISGGNIYYHSNTGYQQLSGVSITAGSAYTLRREVDFRNTQISHYAVYDASGNRLGGADNVTMTSVSVPVTTIGITNTSGTAYIDDYKLYPTGVTTELKTYDAETGIQQANPTAPRTTDTGYRLSWMNASTDNKVVKLYNNGTLVEQVHMAPGQDGVLTGVVNGSSIQLSVAVENADPILHPDYDSGDFNWNYCEHIGGNATCTEQAKCEICAVAYGELAPHTEATKTEVIEDSTGGETGSYYVITYCSVCNTELKREVIGPVSATIGGLNMDAAHGEVKYAIMGAGGVATATDENGAWNIKLDNTGNAAVLSLKDINATYTTNSNALFDLSGDGALVIEVLTPSTIAFKWRVGFKLAMKGGTTITSVNNSLLTITGAGYATTAQSCIDVTEGDLVLENANVNAYTALSGSPYTAGGITVGSGYTIKVADNMTVNGGTLVSTGEMTTMGLHVTGNLTVMNGANVTAQGEQVSAAYVGGEFNVNNATLISKLKNGPQANGARYTINKMPTTMVGVVAKYSTVVTGVNLVDLPADADLLDDTRTISYIVFCEATE